jgi:hypothetical protein
MQHLAEVVRGEISGLPLAITLGGLTFVVFCVLLFIVTRLNPDR